jgi:hypothetical protein
MAQLGARKTSHRVYYVAQAIRANPNVRFNDPDSGLRMIHGVLAMQPFQADDYISKLYSYKTIDEELSPSQEEGLSERQRTELQRNREFTVYPMPYVQLEKDGNWYGSKIMRSKWIEISALCSAGTPGLGRMLLCYALARANWMRSKTVVFALLDRPGIQATFNQNMINLLQAFGFREVVPYYIHYPRITNYYDAKTLQNDSVEKIKATAMENRQKDPKVLFAESRVADLRTVQPDRYNLDGLTRSARRYGFEPYLFEEEVDGKVVERDYPKWFVLPRDPETNLFLSFEKLKNILGVTKYRVPPTPYCGGSLDYLERGYGPKGNRPPDAPNWRQRCGTHKGDNF